MVGADLNEHVGEWNKFDEEVLGRYSVKGRNVEGQMVVNVLKG